MTIGEPSVSNRLRKLPLAKLPASFSAVWIAFSASNIERLKGITTWRVKLCAVSLTILAVMFYVPTELVVSLTHVHLFSILH